MKKISITLFLLLATATGYCVAGNRPGVTTLTLADAYYHFSSKRPALPNAIGMPNLALAYNFNHHWAAEVDVGLINANQRTGSGIHGLLYSIDALYRFNPKKYWEPYVLAGIGMMTLSPAVGNDTGHQGNVNAGIGTQFFADEGIALRAEVRDLYTMSGGKNDWMINFGVSFLIGGNK